MSNEVFSEEQTLNILHDLGVTVASETGTHFLVLCPFHGNLNTPAMVVDKEEGLFYCNNGGCEASGNIRTLIQSLTGKSVFQVEMFIEKSKQVSRVDVVDYVRRQVEAKEVEPFPAERIDVAERHFWESQKAIDYMKGRGFEERTLKEFRVGYYPNKDMILVPMWFADGTPVGVIGRSVEGKWFKNSTGLPRKESLYNIQNAKKSDTVIVTEASFDAMSVWQATGVHGVAVLGSTLTSMQAEQLNKYFNKIVIMSDDDAEPQFKSGRCRKCLKKGLDKCQGHYAGLELGLSIAEQCRGTRIEWGHLDSARRFGGKKDPGELTGEEIRYAYKNAISHFEMIRRVA